MLVCTDSFLGRVAEADRAGDGGTSVGNGSLTFRFSVNLNFLKKIFIFLYHRYNSCRRENILENRLEESKLSHTFAVHKELKSHDLLADG